MWLLQIQNNQTFYRVLWNLRCSKTDLTVIISEIMNHIFKSNNAPFTPFSSPRLWRIIQEDTSCMLLFVCRA